MLRDPEKDIEKKEAPVTTAEIPLTDYFNKEKSKHSSYQKLDVSVLNIATVGGGAAKVRFFDALERVVLNICDQRMNYNVKRKITLKVALKPSEDRANVAMLIHCFPKLAEQTPTALPLIVGMKKDRASAGEAQLSIPDLMPEPLGWDRIKSDVNLDTLGDGAALEAFDYEMGRVVENITDPNVPACAVRTITLTVELSPYPDRTAASVSYGCVTKLIPDEKRLTTFFFTAKKDAIEVKEVSGSISKIFED